MYFVFLGGAFNVFDIRCLFAWRCNLCKNEQLFEAGIIFLGARVIKKIFNPISLQHTFARGWLTFFPWISLLVLEVLKVRVADDKSEWLKIIDIFHPVGFCG